MMLEGWEGFAAMQESEEGGGERNGGWVLCYDRDGDRLRRVRGDRNVLEVELDRVVLPVQKSG